jgi:F0F1-type ATP synthase assembly protein I
MPGPSDSFGGNELVGNVIAGLGLGWLAQHFFPGIAPWGYAVGILLGALSGFYQVLKKNGALGPLKRQQKKKKDDGDGPQP